MRTLAAFVMLLALGAFGPDARAEEPSPFEKVAGRWVGEGRLGIRNGSTENVKCRVTYILAGGPDQVKQTIRCASQGGNVEVQSLVTHAGGALTGTWQELVRNMGGELSGTVTPTGFRVAIKGTDLNAGMHIIVKDQRQIVEIQFHDSSLIGLTLVLTKG
jgi:hypothetical protein